MKRCMPVIAALAVTIALLAAATGASEGQNKPIVPKDKTMLWNGKDFAGWKLFTREPDHDVTKTWSVNNGLIRCEGRPAGYMRTEIDYADYLFHVEWRWPEKGGNNGVLQNVATKCSASSGKICLQSEGTPIEYRNIYIEPLK